MVMNDVVQIGDYERTFSYRLDPILEVRMIQPGRTPVEININAGAVILYAGDYMLYISREADLTEGHVEKRPEGLIELLSETENLVNALNNEKNTADVTAATQGIQSLIEHLKK